jgi:hypothetical protein
MKTKHVITLTTLSVVLSMSLLLQIQNVYAQSKLKVGVIGIDTKDVSIDKESIRNMVLLELEKANVFEVLDKYDVADLIKKEGIDVENCYGKLCQVRVGKLLQSEKMLTGSVERYGEKLIFIFRLIDVNSGNIEKTNVMEYINQQEQIQIMVRMSLNNIMDIENDKLLLDLLVNYDQPIISSKTTLKLNGPRVGATFVSGEYGNIMNAPLSQGGFEMYKLNCLIGYQFERQFLSSGDFQALFEVIPSITGMESGMFVPSVSTLLGFRFNKSGMEFGLGPVMRVMKTARGYYDENGNWHLVREMPEGTYYETSRRLDSRGQMGLTNGMVFAIGKTFRSGYLNLPVNVYYSPRKEGSIIGLVVGFNVANRASFKK